MVVEMILSLVAGLALGGAFSELAIRLLRGLRKPPPITLEVETKSGDIRVMTLDPNNEESVRRFLDTITEDQREPAIRPPRRARATFLG